MPTYPLIFGFRELVAGNGFVAGVMIQGRALLTREDDGSWWVFGVEPGGLCDTGVTQQEAYHNFRDSFREVLHDCASLAPDFETFKGNIERFAAQVNSARAQQWQVARDALRAGALQPEGELMAALQRQTTDVPTRVSVECLGVAGRVISVADNICAQPLAAAA